VDYLQRMILIIHFGKLKDASKDLVLMYHLFSSRRARSDQDKAEVYAQHLESIFYPNNIASKLDMIQFQPFTLQEKKYCFSHL